LGSELLPGTCRRRAGSLDLPEEVAAEVQRFFKMCLDQLMDGGLLLNAATELLSTTSGARWSRRRSTTLAHTTVRQVSSCEPTFRISRLWRGAGICRSRSAFG
jgi:hypothetical protein